MTNIKNNWFKDYNLLIFNEIDSTNDEAKRLSRAGVKGNFLIWARSQTKGRGRSNREWSSLEGNLYMSILIEPSFTIKKASELSLVTAIAVGETLDYLNKSFCQKLKYKWPNDIYFDDKKIGGILLESISEAGSNKLEALIVGIGINILHAPNIEQYKTTFLHNENIKISCEKLIGELMEKFTYYLEEWKLKGLELMKDKWLSRALNLNKVITINVGRNRISGVFNGITSDGNIEIKIASGEICTFPTGEIILQ